MARRHHYKAKSKEPPELDITTFLNLMVVLIPFLLISAVFSRITILELNIPSGAGSNSDDKAKVTIEVIVRAAKLELGNGKGIVAVLPNIEEKFDLPRLSDYLQKIKNNYPDKTDATILLEPDIEYEKMVRVMDAVRSYEIPPPPDQETPTETQKVALFPDLSIGEAP